MKPCVPAIALLLLPGSVLRAAPGGPIPGTAEQQQLYARGMAQLQTLEPGMSTDEKHKTEAIKDILQRVCFDRQHATDSEIKLAAVLLRPESRDVESQDRHKLLQDRLSRMPGVASPPTISTAVRNIPGGARIGCVILTVNGRAQTVVEVPSGDAGRVESVAARLRRVQSADPLWWTRLRAGRAGGRAAVLEPDAPGGDLIAAGPAFARLWGLTPDALARQIVFCLRTLLDPSSGAAASAEMRRRSAISARQRGDEAFSRHDLPTAEAAYAAATRADPGYVIADERLVSLYKSEKQTDKARQTIRNALSVKTLTGTQRRELTQMLR